MYLNVIVLSVVVLFACGGSGGGTSNILTEVPTGKLSGSLGSGDLAGAWRLWMLSTSGGQMREYYFIAEQTSSTTASSFEISGYDVEGTLTFDILDDYGLPTGDPLSGVPFSGTLAGADYNEFNCDFTIDRDGWTGNGSIVGYMADLQPTSAIWSNTFMSNGKFTMSNINGHGHTGWGFRGGWSAVSN